MLDTSTNITTNSASSNYTSDGDMRPALVFSGNLFFGNGRYVMMTEAALLSTDIKITTQKGEEVVFLS